MIDLLLTPQTLVGTVSGAAITLILTACANRLPWRFVTSCGHPALKRQRTDCLAPAQTASTPAIEQMIEQALSTPAVNLPADAPLRVKAHYADAVSRKTRVAPVKAARILIDFMNSYEANGYFTPAEINEWWGFCCHELHLDPLHSDVVRAELAAMPNVWKPNTRLNAPEYRAVKARTGKDRSILYRIPVVRSEPGRAAGASRDSWADTGTAPGQRPANAKKPRKIAASAPASGMVSGAELYREAA